MVAENMMNGERGRIVDKIPWLVSIVGALLLVVAFFIPYASGNEEYKERIAANPDAMNIESIGMTNADSADMSLLEYTRVYMSEEASSVSGLFVIYVPLMVGVLACAVFSFLFAVLRKPIGVMVFSVFTLGLTMVLNWDFEDRGIVPGNLYDWGAAKWVYMAAAAIACAGAVWLLVVKMREKKALRSDVA